GAVEEGVRDVEKGIALAEASGSVVGLPLLYIAAAQVYRMAKQRERAIELIDRAVTRFERTGERAFRVEAGIARAQVILEFGDGAPVEAKRWLLEALEAAGAIDYLQAELIISTQLARLAPRTDKLREAYDRL